MKIKTEEFLNLLMWTANIFARPTFRNLTGSYESWLYEKNLNRRLFDLEKRKLVVRDVDSPRDRLYRLSNLGRLHVLGGRDPQERWSRSWDGYWRLVLFDVPVERNVDRENLRRYLRGRGFGYLQKSVWISPDHLNEESRILRIGQIHVESLLLLEAKPCGGESNSQIVAATWDFTSINRRYEQHLEVLAARPSGALRSRAAGMTLADWAAREQEAWLSAVRIDPLLPEQLLPSGYLGQKSWLQRMKILGTVGQQIRRFDPS
jgi:phenylacetic acid degradation operon negative regulatory protein